MRIRTALVLGPLLALGLAACSTGGNDDQVASANGGSAPASSAGANQPEKEAALKFAQCMRDNGVSTFPDPKLSDNGEAQLSTPDGVDKSKLDAAQEKCKQYLPNGGEPQRLDPQKQAKVREYSQCMRDHGIAKFPDPDENGGIAITGGPGLDPMSAEFKVAEQECAKVMPDGGKGGSTHDEKGNG
jgi:hypothetical protein